MPESLRSTSRLPDAEVIIVGAGPAGSAAATHLADAGHRVLLLDRAAFPRHKACSDYVNPGGVQLLAELGVLNDIRRAGAHHLETMTVHAPDGRRFDLTFGRAEPGRAAIGLTRYRLDHLLLERARAAGAIFVERAHVRQVICENGRVTGVEATINGTRERLHAPIVIGADGHHSSVTRALDLDVPLRWPRKTGLAAHYRGVTGLGQFGEMHVAPNVYAGLAPLEDGLTNVAFVTHVATVAGRPGSIDDLFRETLNTIPEVARKLAAAERVGPIRGVGGMARRARRTTGNGFLLIGDAASFLDPFTGEGVYEALLGAKLAAPVISRALRANDTSAAALDPYRVARRRALTAKREVCWIVQGIINTPALMNYVTARLAQRDELGRTLGGVLGNFQPAARALSPVFLARLLRP